MNKQTGTATNAAARTGGNGHGSGNDNGSGDAMAAGEGDFVSQCRLQVRELSERKLDQEQRLEALIEHSFGQLGQIFDALLQASQATSAASHTQFEEAAATLDNNLDRHQQVEAKLRAIMAILMGGSSQQ